MDIYYLSGDGSHPSHVETVSGYHAMDVRKGGRALINWPGDDPYTTHVMVEGIIAGTLPRRLAGDLVIALKAMRVYANPIQVDAIVQDGNIALDLPLVTIERLVQPTVKPTVHGMPQANRWPDEAPDRPELRETIPDGFPVRTRGDLLSLILLRVLGAMLLGVLLVVAGFLLLYILGNLFAWSTFVGWPSSSNPTSTSCASRSGSITCLAAAVASAAPARALRNSACTVSAAAWPASAAATGALACSPVIVSASWAD